MVARIMDQNDKYNYEKVKKILTENRSTIIGILIGVLVGGSLSFLYVSNKMSRATSLLNSEIEDKEAQIQAKNDEIDDLGEDILELESTVQQKNTEINSLEDTIDELTGSQSENTEEIQSLQDYIEDLEDQIFELESSVRQKNNQIDALEETVEELSGSLEDYEGLINISLLATGTEWENSDDYDLESTFDVGYDQEFLVIYEIENMDHSKIYQMAVDIYIISGGIIHDSIHRSSFGTLPQGGGSQSFYDEFNISSLDYGYYTVILTATDLISGESDTQSYDFEITLS